MRIDDFAKRNPRGHFSRRDGAPECWRAPVAGQGQPALADDMPVLMGHRELLYGRGNLLIPAGSVENVMSPHNVDATGFNWDSCLQGVTIRRTRCRCSHSFPRGTRELRIPTIPTTHSRAKRPVV